MRDSILRIQYRNVRIINHRFHKILFLDYRRLDRVDHFEKTLVIYFVKTRKEDLKADYRRLLKTTSPNIKNRPARGTLGQHAGFRLID